MSGTRKTLIIDREKDRKGSKRHKLPSRESVFPSRHNPHGYPDPLQEIVEEKDDESDGTGDGGAEGHSKGNI